MTIKDLEKQQPRVERGLEIQDSLVRLRSGLETIQEYPKRVMIRDSAGGAFDGDDDIDHDEIVEWVTSIWTNSISDLEAEFKAL